MKKIHLKEIERIQASLPSDIKSRLFKEISLNPTIKEVFERASADETNTEEVRQKAKDVLLTGVLDKTEVIVDEEVAKEANEYFEKEISRSIALGRLPAKLSNSFIKKIWKTSKKESLNQQEEKQ